MTKKQRKAFREKEYARSPYCFWCGEKMRISAKKKQLKNFATIEHLTPKRFGGTNFPENLRLAHYKCNL